MFFWGSIFIICETGLVTASHYFLIKSASQENHFRDIVSFLVSWNLYESQIRETSLTIIHTIAKSTLVSSSTFNKLHEGTHISFAPVASDWSSLTMVYNIKRCLDEEVHEVTKSNANLKPNKVS